MPTSMSSLFGLRVKGAAACLIQIVASVAIPLIYSFLVYKEDARLYYLPLSFAVTSVVVAILGIIAFATNSSMLVSLHAVLAIAAAGALGGVQTSSYLMLVDRCHRSQSSFAGCGGCMCTLYSNCTKALLSSDPACVSCQAMGTDVCDSVTQQLSLMPYMGLISLLLVALPAVMSLRAMSRLEAEQGSIANRLHYARIVVARQLYRLEDKQDMDVPPQTLQALSSTMLAYGTADDRTMALHCCGLAQLGQQGMAPAAAPVQLLTPRHARQVSPLHIPEGPVPSSAELWAEARPQQQEQEQEMEQGRAAAGSRSSPGYAGSMLAPDKLSMLAAAGPAHVTRTSSMQSMRTPPSSGSARLPLSPTQTSLRRQAVSNVTPGSSLPASPGGLTGSIGVNTIDIGRYEDGAELPATDELEVVQLDEGSSGRDTMQEPATGKKFGKKGSRSVKKSKSKLSRKSIQQDDDNLPGSTGTP